VRDTTVSASGGSSLKFVVPGTTIGPDSSGSWFTNFSPDYSVTFGANSEFYVQWRQRFSPEFLTNNWANGEGFKQFGLSDGDPGPGQAVGYCTTNDFVVQNTNNRGFAQAYQSCTGSSSHGPYTPFEQFINGGSDLAFQNARPAPYCVYSQQQTTPPSFFPPRGNCFGYFPNEWMTFQVHVQLGPRGSKGVPGASPNDEFVNSHFDLWIAREGQSSQQVYNFGPFNVSADPGNETIGKVVLLDYDTGRNTASNTYPESYTWYDELVISRNRIADPNGVSPVPTTVSVTAPTQGSTVGGASVTVSASATSNTPIAGIQFKLDGANLGAEVAVAPYSITWDTTQASNGSHTLTAVLRDTAGNLITSSPVTVTVSNLNVTQSVAITAPAGNSTVSGTSVAVSANASSSAGVAGVQFKLDGANLGAEIATAPYTTVWNTTQTSNGTHTLTAVVRDTAGNQAASAAVVVTVNNTPPTTISITAPANGATVSGTSVAVSANATNSIGIAGVQFKLDGSNLGAEKTTAPYTMTWDTTQTANGSHVLTAVARDTAGNQTTSAAVFITINNASLTTVSITAPVSGSTVSGTSVTISANASNPSGIAGVQFKLDGVNLGAEQTAAPYLITWNTAQTPNGSHVLTAVARDSAGNLTTSSAVTVTVTNSPDTTPPTVSITSPLANATVSGSSVSISASASDNVGVAGVQFKVDGVNLGAEQTGTPYTIFWDTTQTSNGNHSLTAVARDGAGNQTTSSAVVVKVSNNANPPPNASVAYSLSDRGTDLLTENSTSGSISVGYARVQTDTGSTALGGAAIFSYHASGALVSETSVPLSPLVQSGRMYVEQRGPARTGVAFANPNSQDAFISFYFTDTDGNDFASGSFTLGATRQKAQFLNESPFFFPDNMEGTLTFTSSVPISMAALRGLTNERNVFLMSTLPVPSLDTSNASPLAVLPHFAIGAGWTTKIILVNPTDGFLSGTAQFFSPAIGDAAVSPMVVTANGVAASGLNYAIPGHSEYAVTLGSVDGSLSTGSIRITAINGAVAPSGLAIFSFTNNGATVSEASIPIAPPALALRVYVESHGTPGTVGSSQTGIALVNPTASPVKVNFDLTAADGTAVGTPTSFMIPPGGQFAKLLNELIPNAPTAFNGVLRASSASPIAGIGMRLTTNNSGDYVMSTIPAVTETQNGTAQQLMFPHIVSGGGFTTELILLNRKPSATSSGKVIFAGQDGSPISMQ
jgi:hypothetical protein